MHTAYCAFTWAVYSLPSKPIMKRKMDTTVVQVGRRIRQVRKAQKISQQELGERANLNYKYIGGVERGERNPSVESLVKIARGLKVDVGNFFKFEDDRQLSEKERVYNQIIGLLGNKSTKELKLAKRMLTSLFKDEG